MISYGVVKIIAAVPQPELDRLIQPFGDASPMGLLWTFMGASESYNLFTGTGEVLGGLLLTTRRTTLLGGLVCFGVMSHVAMLNFSYDLPRQAFFTALAGDGPVPDRAGPGTNRLHVFPEPSCGTDRNSTLAGANDGSTALPWPSGRCWSRSTAAWDSGKPMSAEKCTAISLPDPRFTVSGQSRNSRSMASLARRCSPTQIDGDASSSHPQMIAIQLMSDTRRRYSLKLDPDAKTMALTKRTDPAWTSTLSYKQPEPTSIALEGTMDGQKIRAKLRRTDNPDFLLINRGFHWINEYPFNR